MITKNRNSVTHFSERDVEIDGILANHDDTAVRPRRYHGILKVEAIASLA